ncbi:A-kinase anchor protein 17A-like isoform X2 [Ostrea edulis]|uniref:A-kinase anchor protein 17A-like isoform X2 n=1 Tax=Ostrea edulis TaxID=37623 RepID=UPI0024AEEE94|nr:A-kinase anchor protein 17A-like isoform X2 [Ostrea edulis]
MAGTTLCSDTSEALELYKAQSLYLKPIAKLTVCVQLPKLKEMGKSISNWEVMEKIRHMAKPHTLVSLKIIKSTMEFMRMEGEAETKQEIKAIVQCLDSKTIKLSGYSEVLKVKAAEAKVSHPSQHDWDSFFRDAKNMNEMKAGERPDTIHVKDLPTKWFTNRLKDRPNEQVIKRVFESFGEVRCMDIPMLDPYRKEMTAVKSSGLQTFNFNTGITFDVYIQYKEYISFVKAMDSLRGMKLMYMMDEEKKAYTSNIKVDFDRTKHLSDKSIKKRRIEREKLEQLEREREEKVRKEREEEEQRIEDEKRMREEEEKERERKRLEKIEKRENRRREREEKRRQRAQERKRLEDERKYQVKIQTEERRFLLAQRKLESIRLLGELFNRIKAAKVSKDLAQREIELEEDRRRQVEEETKLAEEIKRKKVEAKKRRKEELLHHETELREKILKNWKDKEEKKEEEMRERLRKRIQGRKTLKSAAVKPSVQTGTTSSEVRPAPSPPDWRQRGEEWIREEYQNRVLSKDRRMKKHLGYKFHKNTHFNPHMEWKKRLKRKETEMRRWKEWMEWKKQFLYWKRKFSSPVHRLTNSPPPYLD